MGRGKGHLGSEINVKFLGGEAGLSRQTARNPSLFGQDKCVILNVKVGKKMGRWEGKLATPEIKGPPLDEEEREE